MILAAGILPPLYLLWKVYQSDRIEKEPAGLLFKIFLFGMLSTLPAGILENVGQWAVYQIPFDEFLSRASAERAHSFVFYFLVVGVAEEYVKYRAMKTATWRSPEFDYVFDGVVYGVTASLGFAALENVLYVMDSGLMVAGVRAWTAIPLHCITGIYMGHYYGIAKCADIWGNVQIRGRMLRRCLLVPILIHGAYDFIATDQNELLVFVFLAYIVVLDIFAMRSLKKYSGQDVRMY